MRAARALPPVTLGCVAQWTPSLETSWRDSVSSGSWVMLSPEQLVPESLTCRRARRRAAFGSSFEQVHRRRAR